MNTVLRKAEEADVATLIALARRTISASYRTVLGDAAVDAFLDSGAVEGHVQENLARCWVILSDGTLAGYAVYRDNLLDLLLIDPARQRQGLGTKLLAHVEQLLFEGCEELTLESFAGNTQANNFYRKNGWLEGDRYFDKDLGVSKVVFRKRA